MFLPLDEMFKPRSRLPVQVDVKNPMALFEKRRGILSLGVLAKNPPNIFARSVAVCGTLLCAIGLGTSEVWTTQKYEIPNLRPVQGNCPGQPSLYLINTVFPCLGIFNHTDTCCREHDHCKHKLAAFEYNYGMRNFRLHTISHCDCDYRFKYCLLQLNDTVSTLVGMAFFNLLEIPCFTLEKVEQCVRWTWWGSCNGTGLVARAMLRSTFRYNYTHPLLDEIRLGWWPTTNLSGGSGSGLFSEMSPPVPVTHWQTPTTKSPKLKGKGRKKGRKGKGQRRKNLKAPSQNALETRLYVWSPGVRVETTGSPRISGSDSVTNRSAETVNMGVITTTIEGQQFTSKHNIPSTMSQREGSTPDTDQPLTHQPLTHQPLTHQPLTHQPLTHQPLTQQPLSQQPLTHQPLTQQPLTQQPLTQQPLTHQPSLTGAVGEIVSTINVRTESRVADLGERLLSSGFEEHSNSTPPTPAGHWGQVDNTGRPIPQRPGLTPNPPDKHGASLVSLSRAEYN
uniref:Phospholipase A2-like central domain-containing protein n=1 Tax=Callorhinchus milii TaxID=7868 RepID=A0A4W3JPA4_CALMI